MLEIRSSNRPSAPSKMVSAPGGRRRERASAAPGLTLCKDRVVELMGGGHPTRAESLAMCHTQLCPPSLRSSSSPHAHGYHLYHPPLQFLLCRVPPRFALEHHRPRVPPASVSATARRTPRAGGVRRCRSTSRRRCARRAATPRQRCGDVSSDWGAYGKGHGRVRVLDLLVVPAASSCSQPPHTHTSHLTWRAHPTLES